MKSSLAKSGFDAVMNTPIFNGLFATGWLQLNLAFLFGGLVLIYKRIIHWQIPVAMLATFAFFSGFTELFSQQSHLHFVSHFFSGAMMLGHFLLRPTR